MIDRLFQLFVGLAGTLLILACVFAFLVAPQGPDGRPPLADVDLDPRALFGAVVYVALTVTGAIAWRLRGTARPEERLPGRQRVLPPAPRGPDA